ncbi:hypothetical protein TIFTF001_034001 [Ficus carica]|uniref:Uncharacterized protein n=1 Tax=Ficus carica TaxID=3494 RepID=A0AA88JA41_FICCA|nr:hypothetical protein TIFTF001_034001 [Ficus carica]
MVAEAARALIHPPFPLIESSPEPSNVLAQPPAKKQKAGEMPVKKAPGKRKREQDKAILNRATSFKPQRRGRWT